MAVYITAAKLKSAKISYSHIIHMAIPYRTAKFKSASIVQIEILGSTIKFNSCQYFRLYSINIIYHQRMIRKGAGVGLGQIFVNNFLNNRQLLEEVE